MNTIEKTVLFLTGSILVFFGLVVGVWALIAKARGRPVKSLLTRYLAWFLIAPPLVIPLVMGRIPFVIVMAVLSMFCFREYARAVGLWKDKGLMWSCYAAIACIYWPILWKDYGIFQAMPIYAIGFILTVPIQRNQYEHAIQKTCLAVLGVAYFGWFLSHLAYLRNLSYGVAGVFLVILLVECNDACAYLWGTLLGKHKLIERLSPNKTVEGMIGSIISVMALALVLRPLLPFVSLSHWMILALALSVFGMCGDLTISFIKRDLNIKDMGSLIPGHGGLLDRFDSIIFTAPIFFHFLRYFYGE